MFAVRERFKLDWITVIGVGILFLLFIVIYIYLIWKCPTVDIVDNSKTNSVDQSQSPFDNLLPSPQETDNSTPILINRDKVEELDSSKDQVTSSVRTKLSSVTELGQLDESFDQTDELQIPDEIDQTDESESIELSELTVHSASRSAYSRQFDRYLTSVELETPQVYGGKDSKFEAMVAEEVRKLFPETIFYKCRPKWLKNTETNCSLEFDLYTHHLEGRNVKMAIEAHGYQHRTFPNRFHRTKAQFDQQRRRDELKVQYCRDLRIILLIVWDDKNTPSKIRNDLIHQLQIYGIVPKSIQIDKYTQ
jgi:hypothetical protein